MGTIISAIDFSECSINALQHALSIAKHCALDLELVWVGKSSKEQGTIDCPIEDAEQRAKEQLEEIIRKFSPEMGKGSFTWKIRHGKVYREIAEEAKDTDAVLVVAGTHGTSGFDEFWIGSNANRIVSACHCPVITIRGGIDIQRPLNKILMPIDSNEETRQKASFTAYLAQKHKAKVIVLKIYSTKVAAVQKRLDVYARQVEKHLDQEGVAWEEDHIHSSKLSDAMIHYAEQVDANLISIMTEQESRAVNLWMGPFAQQVVNHSPIPVLSIHSKATMTIATA